MKFEESGIYGTPAIEWKPKCDRRTDGGYLAILTGSSHRIAQQLKHRTTIKCNELINPFPLQQSTFENIVTKGEIAQLESFAQMFTNLFAADLLYVGKG